MKSPESRKSALLKAIFLMSIFTSTACKTPCDCESIDRKAKNGETLYKICRYLIDNKKTTEPANPCEWSIREMIADTLNGKEILRVKMSCCFMGDEIIIDKKSNEVTGYIPSDK
jgi:hypothetical protein